MKVLAVLQNAYVNSEKELKKFEKELKNINIKEYADIIKFRLFNSNQLTYKNLVKYFGKEIENWIFINATKRIGIGSNIKIHAEENFVKNAVHFFKPDVIIAFGYEAKIALKNVESMHVIYTVHPAARFHKKYEKLNIACKQLIKFKGESYEFTAN